MHRFRKIGSKQIEAAAKKMALAVKPKKIVLFGSYAYGRPTAESDVDFLLIVGNHSRKKRREISLKASDALIPRPFPIDILVRTAQEIGPRIKGGDYFLSEVLEKGRVLYEA